MDQRKSCNRENIEKFDIKLKSKPKDGVILQLHHTIKGSNGESRRIRFSTGTFDDKQEKLACGDNVGNVFILDFSELKFWKLSSIGPCTSLHFVRSKSDTLIAATSKKFEISFVDIDTGHILLSLSGHTAPVKNISFSNSKAKTLLTASPAEAILWELRNHTKYFTLKTYSGAQIQQITFTPMDNFLVACFQNDTVQIWRHDSMKSVKQIIPNQLKHMKDIAFTRNGRAMAMAGLTPLLLLFSMDTWKAIKTIDLMRYNISAVHQISFVPQIFDGGANKIIAILSSDCTLNLFDLESLSIVHKIHPETSGIKKFVISSTGKYLLCILQLGEVNIYNTSFVLDGADRKISENDKIEGECSSIHRTVSNNHTMSKADVEQKMRINLDSARLRRILMQYGEYPNKFRFTIWRSLLDTPRNKSAYAALVDKGIHPAYKDIEKQFTIHSSVTLKNLKRLLSCLAHWCPLFGVMKFLPGFVFPFVKVLQKDPLLLFECTATVLINYCQLWFEYAPFPPISVLAMIENILAEHDDQLLKHFCNMGITSQMYALNILETAFSEVLTCSEWLILWDHILSNEPAFILMAVVSYVNVQKNAITNLKTHEQLERFFRMQNPIDKKSFLKKAYLLLTETPEDIHPRRFFNTFSYLAKGECYQQFNGYPKATVCLKLAKNDKRKSSKNEKYTLRELTIKCQEREISERIKAKQETVKTIYNDNCLDENCKDKQYKRVKKKSNDHIQNKGDFLRKKEKEELLDNIIYPTCIHLQKNKIQADSQCRIDGSNIMFSKTKRISSDQKNKLEKVVEKLIKSYSNSDISCS